MALDNFSIILPGGCNAKCAFCQDRGDVNVPENWDEMLVNAIDSLPDHYRQVSITGGETSVSPKLFSALTLIRASGHFDKVVLTSNGTDILKNADLIFNHINHLNISRHAVSDKENRKIFGNKRIPDSVDLEQICHKAHSYGVDVCLNVVYTADSNWTQESVLELMNSFPLVDSFSFRYDQHENTLEETYLEKLMCLYPVAFEGGCPVCRSKGIMVKGRLLVFKSSFAEPSESLDELYELIFHEDGTLSVDWQKKKIYMKKTIKKKEPRTVTMTQSELDAYVNAAIEASKRAEKKVPIKPSLSKPSSKTTTHSGSCGYGGCGNPWSHQTPCGRSKGC